MQTNMKLLGDLYNPKNNFTPLWFNKKDQIPNDIPQKLSKFLKTL